MNLTVFGGSGVIGTFLIKNALNKNFHVKAYVRNPNKLTILHPNLEIIKGELNNYQAIKNVIAGSDAVISTLGVPLARNYEGMEVLGGHENIIRAMGEEEVSRFITLGTPSVKFGKDKTSIITIFPGIMAGLLFPKAKEEIVQVGRVVAASNLDWTIVRILAPKNTPATGRVKITFGNEKIKFNISREDIAIFMLEQVEDARYYRSMPIIGS